MTKLRMLASVLLVGLAGLSVGAVGAWFSDSGTMQFQIAAADDFGDGEPTKVWVCKLAGPPEAPFIPPGLESPIHVSIDSLDAQGAFSDAHPSYIVENGDILCVVPTPEEETTSAVVGRPLPDPTTTTSTTSTTTTSTTTSTSTTTTTTTITTVPEATTTTSG